METNEATITALAALANDTRLSAFRLLVQAGPGGLAAGQLADALGAQPQTLSFHLKELSHAGLIARERQGRSILYRAEFDRMVRLLTFLSEDCCGGQCSISICK